MSKYRKKSSKKAILVTTAVVVGAGFLFAVLEVTDTTSILSRQQTPSLDAQTTSELPSAQPDYNGGSAAEINKDPGNTGREDQGTATVTDNNGSASTDKSTSISSDSGEITVFLPHADSLIKSGQEISGSSLLPSVSYRLIDNVSGVIGTGNLTVVGGNFSGTLNFSTGASEGRLDIFGVQSDANEFSNIEIPVRFQ